MFWERARGLTRSAVAHFRRHVLRDLSVGALLSIVLVALLRGEAINVALAYLEKQALHAWHWIQRPIDVALAAGLAFLVIWFAVWITVAIIAAYVEERRLLKLKHSAIEIDIPLSAEERYAIQDARRMWKAIGREETHNAVELLNAICESLSDHTPVAPLIAEYSVKELQEARALVEEAVKNGADVHLGAVVGRLLDLCYTYRRMTLLIRRCKQAHPDWLTGRPYADKLQAWESKDQPFIEALRDLSRSDDYTTLAICLPDRGAV